MRQNGEISLLLVAEDEFQIYEGSGKRNLITFPARARVSHLEWSFRRVVFDELHFYECFVKRHPAIARTHPFTPLGMLQLQGQCPGQLCATAVEYDFNEAVNLPFSAPHEPSSAQHNRAGRQFRADCLCGKARVGRGGWLVIWVLSSQIFQPSNQPVGLGVRRGCRRSPDFFQMAVIAKFADGAGSRAVADARY